MVVYETKNISVDVNLRVFDERIYHSVDHVDEQDRLIVEIVYVVKMNGDLVRYATEEVFWNFIPKGSTRDCPFGFEMGSWPGGTVWLLQEAGYLPYNIVEGDEEHSFTHEIWRECRKQYLVRKNFERERDEKLKKD